MKFSELKSKVEDLGYWVSVDNDATIIGTNSHHSLYMIKNDQCGLMSYYSDATYLEFGSLLALQKLAYKYSRTPINEREDELKFRVKMLPEIVNCYAYLNQSKRSKNIFLDDSDENDYVQTIFTNSEYEKLQQKYHEWLPKFDEKDPHFEFLEEEKWKTKRKLAWLERR